MTTPTSAASISLSGKVAIVTGASSGIGHATALALARHGVHLVVTARRAERLITLCSQIQSAGGRCIFHAGDAANEQIAKHTVQLAISTFGRLDILINNAGTGNYKNLVDTSALEYDQLMDANMKSSFLFSRYAVPHMIAQKSGVLLFISSIAGLQGVAGEAVYCASKFAQVGFSQALDAELRKHNINVGVLCPGGTKTEFALGKGRTEESVRSSHMMDSADVANAILFACTQPPNTRIPQMIVRHMG
jgi:NADP-dependent 3-hydroxy acid dehydrogenase YdfG